MAVLLAVLVLALSLAGAWLTWRRMARLGDLSIRLGIYALIAGALGGGLTTLVERVVLAWTELDLGMTTGASSGVLMATFLLAVPLEEAAKVLAVWPLYRTHRILTAQQGLAYAVAAAGGFAVSEGALIILHGDAAPVLGLRVSLGALAHLFFAGAWGFALGAGQPPGRFFSVTWIVAVFLHGLFDYIVWGRGVGYLAVALPMLGFMTLATWITLRGGPADSRPSRPSVPPGFEVVRRALRPGARPPKPLWIVAGAFVTLGLVLSLGAAGVFLGHRLGIDFSTADEFELRSAGPIMLLGTAVLVAFPVAGYLLARASAAFSVLEPALGTLLAVGVLVAYFAVTSPVAILFALAVAPVAVGLACGGAWIGLER